MAAELLSRPQSDESMEDVISSTELEQTEKQYEYEVLADPDLRREYVNYTDRLIAHTLEQNTDTVIFLDKSARPVSWLMRSLWPKLGFKKFDENGNPIMEKMPEMKFLNIDREKWEPMMGRSEGRDGAGITLDYVPDDTIDSLTGLYAERTVGRNDFIGAEEPTFLDDKDVLIVDEVRVSGDTLEVAQALVGKAFKNAHSIRGNHWMSPAIKVDPKTGVKTNSDLPVWYSDDTPKGRLVADVNSRKSGNSPSLRQQRGSQFLSTRFDTPDKKGIQLRKEMQQIGEEVMANQYPIVPSATRNLDRPFIEQYIRYTSDLSLNEFRDLREQAERENTSFTKITRDYKHDRDNTN